MPLLLAYRILHPAMKWLDSERFTVDDKDVIVQGRGCIIVRSRSGPRQYVCSVDPQRDYSIVRFEEIVSDKLALQINIDYFNDREHGWVPSAWNISMFNTVTFKVREGAIAKIKTHEINVPIEKKEFQIEFPAGTEVVDRKSKQEHIVLDDGKRRLITQEERLRNATYQQFLESESGMAGLPKPRFWQRMSVWFITLLFLVTFIILWRRRLFRRRYRVHM
jgi:hypothetical protein